MLTLHLLHGALVVVESMEGGCGGVWDPCTVSSCHGMTNLLLEHLPHVVWGCPHPLPDLSSSWKLRHHAAVDVPVLVGLEPGLLLQLRLGIERSCSEARVDFVSSAVKETGVDEDNPVLSRPDRLVQVHRHPPLFVHHPHLQGVPSHPQEILCGVEQRVDKRHLLGPVHLWPHDVDASCPRVLCCCIAAQVMQGGQAGDGKVEHVLGYLAPVLERHCVCV
mmetsp:Transcript_10221/g.23328  ORF Transcript_10221/g.23328 Transcript_10221/m.23328 type:complete len:220 (-) Transcript_10221:1160-1819(-)